MGALVIARGLHYPIGCQARKFSAHPVAMELKELNPFEKW